MFAAFISRWLLNPKATHHNPAKPSKYLLLFSSNTYIPSPFVIVKDPGTVVLYVILGLAGLAYLFTLLARNRDATTTCFALVVAVIVVGLIFDPDSKKSEPQVEQINLQSNQSTIENFSPQYFSLEKIDYFSNISSNTSFIVSTTYSLIYIVGTVLLTSLRVSFACFARPN